MTKQQAYIDFIVSELQAGNVLFERVFELFRTKFNTARPTFSKYWKMAQQAHSEARQEIERKKSKEYTEAELKRAREAGISREKAVEMMANVVKLSYNRVINSKADAKDVQSFNNAFDKYARLEGLNKPDKIAQTDSDGDDISPLLSLIRAAPGVKRKKVEDE